MLLNAQISLTWESRISLCLLSIENIGFTISFLIEVTTNPLESFLCALLDLAYVILMLFGIYYIDKNTN